MIERVVVNGREGVGSYIDGSFEPVDAADAVFLKVLFDDGGQLTLAVPGQSMKTKGHYIQDPTTGLLMGSEPGPGDGAGEGGGEGLGKPKPFNLDTENQYQPSTQSLNKPENRNVDHVIDSVPGARPMVNEARAKVAANPIMTDNPKAGYKNPNGSWNDERNKVHDKILDKFINSKTFKAAIPAPGERPTLYLLGGRGGSGKSWFTKEGGKIDLKKAYLLNNDEVKKELPDYKGWNAALVHEESSEIGDRMERIARDQKLNIVLDGTMRNPANVQRRVDEYRKLGYRIEGYYMYASPATAAQRALQRFVDAEKRGEEGRFVPPEYSLESTTNEAAFDSVRDSMDHYEVYDNNEQDFNPKLYAIGGRQANKTTAVPARYSPRVMTPANPTFNDAKDVKRGWIATSPVETIDQVMKLAEPSQAMLTKVGSDIADKLGVTANVSPFSKVHNKNGSIKQEGVDRVKDKAKDRGNNIAAVTDVARMTFVVDHPGQSDAIFAELGKHFEVAAEPWKLNEVNYADRSANVRLPNGLIAEVQVMDTSMAQAKSPDGGGGHDWYKVARKADPRTGIEKDRAKYDDAQQKMRDIYTPVLNNYSSEWKAAFGIGGKTP